MTVTTTPGGAMRRVALRNLAAHKVRLALTVLSVVLGTAFISGSLVFTDTLSKTFNGLFADTGKGVDYRVRVHDDRASGVPLADAATIKAMPGVRAVEAQVSGNLVLFGKDGTKVNPGGAPSIGMQWVPTSAHVGTPIELASGRGPNAPNEIALNSSAAKKAGLVVGDRTKILVPNKGIINVTVSGIYTTKTETGGFIGAMFTLPQSISLFTDGVHVSGLDVARDASSGVSSAQLRSKLSAAFPNAEIVTGAQLQQEQKDSINSVIGFFNTFLLAFGGIALLVGTFIIYNTFSMILAQRLRELALLRAIGASSGQIRRSVFVEAMAVGAVGSVIGIAGGFGLASGLRALLNTLNVGLPDGPLQLEVRTIVVALLVGVGVTVVSALAPARRAARTAPVEAMREEFASIGTSLRRRTIVGAVLGAGGVALAVLGAVKGSGSGAALVGGGAVLLILSLVLAGPALARPVIAAIGPITAPFGEVGRLSRTNAVRNPRRTAATAFALTLGLTLVAAIAVLGASTKQSLNKVVDNGVSADYILTGPDGIGVPAGVGEAAAAVSGVQSVVTLHPIAVKLDGKSGPDGTGVDGYFASVAKLSMISGVSAGGNDDVIAGETFAKNRGWSVGSSVVLANADGKAQTVKVVGLYRDNQLIGEWAGSNALYKELATQQTARTWVVLVRAAAGTDLGALRTGLENATNQFLVVDVQDREQFKGSLASQVNTMMGVLVGMLALAIIIAILGIINTLALSVVERRREIGMLRAVGMQQAQVRRTIYLESLLIATFGAVTGVVLGLGLGIALVKTLGSQGLDSVAVPFGQIGAVLVLAAVVGVLAALWPGVRAARTSPLAAIATG